MKAALVLLLAVGLGGCDRYTYRQNRVLGGTEMIRTDRLTGKTDRLSPGSSQWEAIEEAQASVALAQAPPHPIESALPANEAGLVTVTHPSFEERGLNAILGLIVTNRSAWNVTSIQILVKKVYQDSALRTWTATTTAGLNYGREYMVGVVSGALPPGRTESFEGRLESISLASNTRLVGADVAQIIEIRGYPAAH